MLLYKRKHGSTEVQAKKMVVLKHTGRLACEICGFTFGAAYGPRGVDFIECHHVTPLSEIEIGRKTRFDDLALVCANCHRMIHAKRPWLTIEQLREIVARSFDHSSARAK